MLFLINVNFNNLNKLFFNIYLFDYSSLNTFFDKSKLTYELDDDKLLNNCLFKVKL